MLAFGQNSFHCCLVRAYFSLLPLARNLVWLTAGPFGAPFRRGRSSRFGQIWKRGPGCQGALRWRCLRMVRGNSSPINGENQRFWKHLSKIFLPERNSRYAFSQPPHPYMGKIGQNDTTSRKFFQHADCHRRFLPSLLNVQIRAFWKPLSKFFEITSHEYQKPAITHAISASTTSCQRLHIARCPSMQKSRQSGNTF